MTFLTKYRIFYISLVITSIIAVTYAITQGLWLYLLLSLVILKFNNLFGLSIGLHRYFCHRGFKTTQLKHNLLLALSVLTGQGTPITWTAHHLHHHKHSDTDKDLHSPRLGFFYTVFIWPIAANQEVTIVPKPLLKDKAVVGIHRHYFKIWTILILSTLTVSWYITVFVVVIPAGLGVIHANLFSNYLSHLKLPGSYHSFVTNDTSYNNKWIQRWQLGEGLHNNHHADMSNYNQASKPDEFDIAAWTVDKCFKV